MRVRFQRHWIIGLNYYDPEEVAELSEEVACDLLENKIVRAIDDFTPGQEVHSPQQPTAPERLPIDKLDELPAKTMKLLKEAGFQFVDELTAESLTGKPGIGEATRLSILAAVEKVLAAAVPAT